MLRGQRSAKNGTRGDTLKRSQAAAFKRIGPGLFVRRGGRAGGGREEAARRRRRLGHARPPALRRRREPREADSVNRPRRSGRKRGGTPARGPAGVRRRRGPEGVGAGRPGGAARRARRPGWLLPSRASRRHSKMSAGEKINPYVAAAASPSTPPPPSLARSLALPPSFLLRLRAAVAARAVLLF